MSAYLGSSGSPGESNIKAGPESSRSIVLILHVEHGAVNVGVALVDGVQFELLEDPPGQQQPGAVGGGVVGQTDWDTVAWELMSVSGADNNVTLETGIGDLGDDVLVGDADYQSVFWGVVLVLVLDTQALTGEVIGLT